jgi:hypothetical protein
MRRIYFAHPINTYNTDLEHELIQAIHGHFESDIIIVNPSDLVHQVMVMDIKAFHDNAEVASQKVMEYFLHLTATCQGGVGLPFHDGMFGAGVYTELKHIEQNHHTIWIITHRGDIEIISDLSTFTPLSVDDTRARIRNTDHSHRSYF